jgi:hypothetical protein
MVALSVKHMLVHHIHLHTFPSFFCRDNKLGAAGAKELVKADWPELRLLDIGWGDVRCCFALTSATREDEWETLRLSSCHHTVSCRFNQLGAEGAAHLATGRWPKLQKLDIR